MSGAEWRLWVLGTGTALPSAQRDNTYLALVAGADCWLIDCGSAPYQRLLQVGVSPLRLRGIVLTHAHADHLYGLPVLLFQLSLGGYKDIVPIYGLSDTVRIAQRVVESFELGRHSARPAWCVLEDDMDINLDAHDSGRGALRAKRVSHSLPAVGVRMTAPGGQAVAYSGDTAPCAATVDLARGAEWLLHECTVRRAAAGHSTPEQVGRVASEGGVGHLGIVHYDPLYVVAGEELVAGIRRGGYMGEIRVFGDMQSMVLQGAGVCS
jgi:ribonuclease Z